MKLMIMRPYIDALEPRSNITLNSKLLTVTTSRFIHMQLTCEMYFLHVKVGPLYTQDECDERMLQEVVLSHKAV